MKLQDLNIGTVRMTWKRWVKEGMEALSDKPRIAAPLKLDATAVERLLQQAREEPLSTTKLLQRHIEVHGTPVEVNTLFRALKPNDFMRKRTCHSLKNSAMLPPSPSPAKRSTS